MWENWIEEDLILQRRQASQQSSWTQEEIQKGGKTNIKEEAEKDINLFIKNCKQENSELEETVHHANQWLICCSIKTESGNLSISQWKHVVEKIGNLWVTGAHRTFFKCMSLFL